MAAKHLYGMDFGIEPLKLKPLAEFVSVAANRPIPVSKPFLGSNCFAHEAGIHADGIIKDAKNYEPYDPEEMGLERKIVIGKHSGRNTLVTKLKDKGITLDDEDAVVLLDLVRRYAVKLHRSISEDELVVIYNNLKKGDDPFDDEN
jgi:homocitrate synthase NifV